MLIFISAIYAFNFVASDSEDASLRYYDASNALKFIENDIYAKNIQNINETIYNYLGYKSYYIIIKYYNETGIENYYELGNKEHANNYCSSKEYFINGKLIYSMICLWDDTK